MGPVRKRSISNKRIACEKNPQVSDSAPSCSCSNRVKVLACIPARYGSTRFPGKVLAKDTGKFLIQHTYERACLAKLPQKVIIAADDQRICDAAKSFGAECVLTSPDHASGTDRIAEAVADIDVEIVINLQADEPEIDSANIDYVAQLLMETQNSNLSRSKPRELTTQNYGMATLAAGFKNAEQIADPNIVKVVVASIEHQAGGSVKRSLAMAIPKASSFEATTQRRTSDERRATSDDFSRAIYFSRSPIPFNRETGGIGDVGQYLRHIGIYAYRKEFLLKITAFPQTILEKIEKLEQLRAIENGFDILVGKVQHTCDGIDTPEQYAEFVKRYKNRNRGHKVHTE